MRNMFKMKRKIEEEFTIENVVDMSLKKTYDNEREKEKNINTQTEIFIEYLKNKIWAKAKEGKFEVYTSPQEFYKKVGSRKYYDCVMTNIEEKFKSMGFEVNTSEIEGGYLVYEINWRLKE